MLGDFYLSCYAKNAVYSAVPNFADWLTLQRLICIQPNRRDRFQYQYWPRQYLARGIERGWSQLLWDLPQYARGMTQSHVLRRLKKAVTAGRQELLGHLRIFLCMSQSISKKSDNSR